MSKSSVEITLGIGLGALKFMTLKKLLIADRGEIAIRIARAAAELGIRTVAIFSDDDTLSLHTRKADEARPLNAAGSKAYLDGENILAIAKETECDAIHPGSGFLSEDASFARRCLERSFTFAGPRPEILEFCADAARVRSIVEQLGILVLASDHAIPRARQVVVQIVGDGSGAVSHLWERECSIQRRNHKLVEVAPSPGLPRVMRGRLLAAAISLAQEMRYDGIGSFEFLVDGAKTAFAFIGAQPRLQAEHTVTEEVTGIDIVKTQLQLAAGKSLADLRLTQLEIPAPRGFAMQLWISLESMGVNHAAQPSGGTLNAFELPSGPGIRVDTSGYTGYPTNPALDSTLAKLVAHSPSPDFADVVTKTYRALCEFRIEGVPTNLAFLQNLLRHPDFIAHRLHTRFIDDHIAELLANPDHQRLFFDGFAVSRPAGAKLAGVKIDARDPLAVLDHGKSDHRGALRQSAQVDGAAPSAHEIIGPEGTVAIVAPMQGTIVSIDAREGDSVRHGQQLLVMEAMKMEHGIRAHLSGIVRQITVAIGDAVFEGHPLAFIEEREVEPAHSENVAAVDLNRVRPDLAEVHERHEITLDAARPEAVARRRKTHQRTARENIEDICDPGAFVEYGPLVVAAQRRRRTLDDLIRNTPADGMVTGLGSVNGDLFGPDKARCVLLAYDYTVLAGTQGHQNHRKKDRMFQIAAEFRLPLVLFAEGGGGRPGDTDGGFSSRTFHDFPKLSGLVPMVGITSGRCYAGNASLLGCCDVVIATKGSNIGMGGPAMIEGGGLGIFRPEEIGPMDVQVPNGVVDVAVADEAEAVQAAKKYLSYFQGSIRDWECPDQRRLRGIIPENRLRVYDIREVIATMADTGSTLELRPRFGLAMITAFIRIEGRPMGVVANNPMHLAGAIDSDGADKAARFIKLCDAFDIPILFLCDTPGIMVGPEVEKTALVRHSSRMFVTAANVTVPFFTVVLRKAYGLGGIAMGAGSFDAALLTVAWPTGEFGPMGLEGAVKLGYRNELAAINDPAARKKRYDDMVAAMYERGKALNNASHFTIDDVIDPADSRRVISASLRNSPPPEPRTGKKHPYIDTW